MVSQYDGVAGITQSVQWLGHGLGEWEIVVRFPAEATDIFHIQNV
jgi:hypothetical protein